MPGAFVMPSLSYTFIYKIKGPQKKVGKLKQFSFGDHFTPESYRPSEQLRYEREILTQSSLKSSICAIKIWNRYL